MKASGVQNNIGHIEFNCKDKDIFWMFSFVFDMKVIQVWNKCE